MWLAGPGNISSSSAMWRCNKRHAEATYIALFKVVHVHLDPALYLVGCLVDCPARAPPASPAIVNYAGSPIHLSGQFSIGQAHQNASVLYLLPTTSNVYVGFSVRCCSRLTGAGACSASISSTTGV